MNNVENEIIKGLRDGNRDIFNMVFKSFYSILVSFARDLLKSYDLAREVVQEIFVRLWENHTRINIQTSLKAYLYKSVNNACLNYMRNNKRSIVQPVDVVHLHYLEDLVADDSNWLNTPGQLEMMEANLRKAIDHLPDQCRQIFLLCRFEHLTYPQIAEKLSVSLSTVKTQMGRAMAKLKEALEE